MLFFNCLLVATWKRWSLYIQSSIYNRLRYVVIPFYVTSKLETACVSTLFPSCFKWIEKQYQNQGQSKSATFVCEGSFLHKGKQRSFPSLQTEDLALIRYENKYVRKDTFEKKHIRIVEKYKDRWPSKERWHDKRQFLKGREGIVDVDEGRELGNEITELRAHR